MNRKETKNEQKREKMNRKNKSGWKTQKFEMENYKREKRPAKSKKERKYWN